MPRKLFFHACFFLCTVHCFAQQYPFVYYTPKDGLVNSRVRSIKQDSKGRMYFITYGGLSVYDGARFVNYNQQNGLANELVNDVVEITPDSILVATNTQMLNTLVRGKAGIFKTTDGFYPVVNRFLKSSDGLWYATADGGLFVLKEKKFIRLPFTKDGKDLGANLDRIIEWQNYFLIISWNTAVKEKLFLYNKLTGNLDDVFTEQSISGLDKDANGLIWIVTAQGILHPNISALKKGQLLLMPSPVQYPFTKNQNINIFFDASGAGWLFGGNQVHKISPHPQPMSGEQGLKAGNLTALFQDREGIMWMASDGNGVVKLKSANIQLLNTILPNHQMLFSAMQTKEDTTWLWDATGNAVYRIVKEEIKSFRLNQKMQVINIYISGDKIYLTDDKKILLVDQKNNQASYFNAKTILNVPSPLLSGTGILDPYGSIIHHTQKSDTGFFLCVIKDKNILSQFRISYATDQMAIDAQRRLWVVTRNSHLILFSLHPEDPQNYLQLVKDFSTGLGEISPRSITVDKQNNIWIGTRYHGLCQFRLKNLQLVPVKRYTTKDGLTDNFIFRLCCDSSNNIWIGTQTGLDKLFFKNDSVVIANIGKSNNIFQRVLAIEASKNGTVWAMNSDGTILKIMKDSLPSAAKLPSLLLTSLKVNELPVDITTNEFSFKQNNFSFTIAAPSFTDERSITYSYLLEGSGQKSWSERSNVTALSFINLSPGNYTLRIKCFFPESIYPPQSTDYSFTILHPWWQSWWFQIAIFIFSIGTLIFIIRNYYRRKLEKQKMLLERKQAIEKERTRIATDMHDDLGAGLSRIKFLSETIGIKKQQLQPIEEDISKIREYSHQMIDKMGEIVWALNEKNDSLSDLLAYTRAYSVEYLEQNGISCSFHSPDILFTDFVSGEFRRNIFLSVKEILHNVIKHSGAAHVTITVTLNKKLHFHIRDNGSGFDTGNIRAFSNGLYNIKKRMLEIDGKMEMETKNGTSIFLSAPLPS